MLTVDYDRLRLEAGMTMLDLGAGFGRHAFESARRGVHVVAADLAFDEMNTTQATFTAMFDSGELSEATKVGCLRANGLGLPFADLSFDRIIAAEILEHVPDDLGVLQELSRVLKPGGILAVTVPAAIPEQICWWLDDAYHAPKSAGGHIRVFSRVELATKIASVGLEPTEHHRAHALHTPYWWLKCAVGVGNEDNPLVRSYLRFLTWDIMHAPRSTRVVDRLLNPVLGKSLVQYSVKG
jgi:SAM-dependent methyltransferase